MNFVETKLQVQIDSPQVIIPGSDDSDDRVVADLGDFTMHNNIASLQQGAPDTSQTFVCTLSKIHLKSIHHDVETHLLYDVKLDILVVTGRSGLMVRST